MASKQLKCQKSEISEHDQKPKRFLTDSGKNKPLKKVKTGRFQISTWVFRRLFTNGDKDSTIYLEKWVDVERACIQYSTYNRATGQWENQSIWCSIDDLRSLAGVVEQLNEEDNSSSPFSCEAKEGGDNEEKEVQGFSQSSEEKSSMKKEDEVMKMRRMKLFNLVEYLKSVDFYHDTFELEEKGLREILSEYGINDEFTEEELKELRKDLYELAEKNEFGEAMILAANTETVGGMRMVEVGF